MCDCSTAVLLPGSQGRSLSSPCPSLGLCFPLSSHLFYCRHCPAGPSHISCRLLLKCVSPLLPSFSPSSLSFLSLHICLDHPFPSVSSASHIASWRSDFGSGDLEEEYALHPITALTFEFRVTGYLHPHLKATLVEVF